MEARCLKCKCTETLLVCFESKEDVLNSNVLKHTMWI
jgi:hypothetical protein